MAYSVITSGSDPGNVNTATTPSMTTTGADLVVIAVVSYQVSTAPTLTDSKGNTWTPLTVQSNSGLDRVQLFYCQNPTVGAGHTFTASLSGSYPSIFVYAFSGSITSPFDVQNGAADGGGGTTKQPGSVTPSQNDELIVTGASWWNGAGVPTIDSSFTGVLAYAYSVSNFGGAIAYLIQTTASAVNPTWTWGASQTSRAAVIATFKAATAGGLAIPVLMSHYRRRWS